jgi:uncharacterized membrane protein
MQVFRRRFECVLSEECIDQYLWSVYERARKVDTIKVQERIKATVKKNGKSRTVTKTITKLVDEDFTWKDPHAAKKAGMSVAQYVIGGMDRGFRLRLYRLFHLMQMIGWLMIALFVWLFHGPWLAFKRAVDVEDWPSATATLNRIRQIIAVNLPLGLLVVVIGGSGRYWG